MGKGGETAGGIPDIPLWVLTEAPLCQSLGHSAKRPHMVPWKERTLEHLSSVPSSFGLKELRVQHVSVPSL